MSELKFCVPQQRPDTAKYITKQILIKKKKETSVWCCNHLCGPHDWNLILLINYSFHKSRYVMNK